MLMLITLGNNKVNIITIYYHKLEIVLDRIAAIKNVDIQSKVDYCACINYVMNFMNLF